MDEIAPEYDVVVLGTGGFTSTPPDPLYRANTPQVSQNASFQGNTHARFGDARADKVAVFSVSRARKSSTSTATTTTEGEHQQQLPRP